MYRLIENIQREAISNRWANNKGAQFEYDNERTHYRLIEITPDCKTYLVGRTQRNNINCPVIAKGFVAYLIRYWGKSEQLIFDNYYENGLNNFKRIESRKPGSSMRDLDAEFYPIHISQEREFAKFSELIHPYLSNPDIELINQYTEAYFNYIEQFFAPKEITEPVLSVSDWSIIFYYLDEAGKQEGKKIDRIEKFIKENNVLSPSSGLTTIGNFKKEYHEIENRINGKNDKKSLPPERIENILHYLKNNKKALQAAKNDIEHLTNEIEESKENTY